MRKTAGILLSFALVLLFSVHVAAQDKPTTKITTVKQKKDLVRFSLVSSQPFIFGSNRYVLHIGNHDYTRNEQWHKRGKGYLTFLIEADAFSTLQDGADIYLTYGDVDTQDTNMEQMAKDSKRCWSLGKFSKKMLTK